MNTKQKQCLLLYLAEAGDRNYDPGAVDGLEGPKTASALAAFRADYGVGEEGLVGAIAGTVCKVVKPPTELSREGMKYFRREEFRCKCGGKYCNGFPVEMDLTIVRIADKIRERIGKPLTVTSGIRCRVHNANEGGVSNSQHLYGTAIDLAKPVGVSPQQMAKIAEEVMGGTGGIGIYSWGIHIDCRKEKSRWNG